MITKFKTTIVLDNKFTDCIPTENAIQNLIVKYISKELEPDSKEWLDLFKGEINQKKLLIKTFIKRLWKTGRNGRDQEEILKTYNEHYSNWNSVQEWVKSLDKRFLNASWNNRRMIMSPQALRLTHLFFIEKIIKKIQPKNVLELGAGNFNLLFSLALKFPKSSFHGLEKSPEGVHLALKTKNSKTKFKSVENIKMKTSVLDFINVQINQGDAVKTKFKDNQFDLVYTRLALEQMEGIRGEVLSELRRISKGYVFMIEPWANVNTDKHEKAYIRRMGYFNANINDLKNYGFEVVYATSNMPQKIPFKVAAVLVKIKN